MGEADSPLTQATLAAFTDEGIGRYPEGWLEKADAVLEQKMVEWGLRTEEEIAQMKGGRYESDKPFLNEQYEITNVCLVCGAEGWVTHGDCQPRRFQVIDTDLLRRGGEHESNRVRTDGVDSVLRGMEDGDNAGTDGCAG